MRSPQLLYLGSGLLIVTGIGCGLCLTLWMVIFLWSSAGQPESPPVIPRVVRLPTATRPPLVAPQASTPPVEQNPTAPQGGEAEPPLMPPLTDTLSSPTPAAEASIVIADLDPINDYVDLRNMGGAPQDLTGWRLFSEVGAEECPLAGVIGPGETLRVWSQAGNARQEGYSCGLLAGMWDDEGSDGAILYNPAGEIVYQRP